MNSHLEADTIVALASPPGRGHRAIVRLSGPEAVSIAAAFFHAPQNLEEAPGFSVLDGAVEVDAVSVPARAYVMRAPAAYTREDVVEFHLPASNPLLQHVIRAMMGAGARHAEPGEFTERAFLNGRIDLAQAEAVLRAVHAVHLTELRNAVAQLRGFAYREIDSLRGRIVELMSLLELNIDFSDQDIVLVDAQEVRSRIDLIQGDIGGILRRASRLVPAEGIPVVLYGPANAGKSTLFNALVGEEQAIVSHLPGTTRDYLQAGLEIDGVLLRLVDTAGIRETEDLVEQVAQARSHEQAAVASLLVCVLDVRGASSAAPCPGRKPDIVVLNKADLADAAAPVPVEGWPCRAIAVSALRGDGLGELKRALVQAVELQVSGSHAFVPNLRQTVCMEEARGALDAALSAPGEELTAYELRRAARVLGEVIGEVPTDELLDRIFSRFCIGK